jgi:uncharacterized protein YrrD
LKTATFAVLMMVLAITPAHPQQTQNDSSTKTQAKTPISGIVDTALAGSKVYEGDTSIGQIEDVLVDLDRATVSAVILSVGGFLGIGDKLVAVSVNQIKIGSEAKFTTDLTKEQLANAPAFDFGKLK